MLGTLNTCDAEYAKDPIIKPEDIRSLMEWLKKEPHMPNVTEYQVIQFYQASEYSILKTKHLLDVHYSFRNEAAEFFIAPDVGLSPTNVDIWGLFYGFDLPKSTPKGYRLVYSALRNLNASCYNFQTYGVMYVRLLLSLILEQGICPGYSLIIDFKGFGFIHLARVNLLQLKKFVDLAQETCQLRTKEIHLINGPGVIEKCLFLIKPFMKKELMDMIHVHSDINTLFDHTGKNNIPVDLGGSMPQTRDELNDNMKKRIDSLSTFVQEELDKRANESLRIGDKKNNVSQSYGSFKRIMID